MIVLVTRAEDDARRSAALLQQRGHTSILSPILSVRALDARAPHGDFDAALGTSAHAFASRAHESLTRLPLHAVGARTAQAARAAGFDVAFVAEDAARLAEHLARMRASRFVYFAGRARKADLEQALARAGHSVSTVETYDAEPARALSHEARDALAAGALSAALHYSPRSAEIFCALVDAHDLRAAALRLRHVAISQDAAAPLRARGLTVIVAEAPKEEAMLAALEQST